MAEVVLALDLGTGGCKASMWTTHGACVAEAVVDYPTTHPRPGWNEQRPEDWWHAVAESVRKLMEGRSDGVCAIAVSGHSLGAVLLDDQGELLIDHTPIWSDTRAGFEADRFFELVDGDDWYLATGNGFAPEMYPVFKAMWYQDQNSAMLARTRHLIGSKDWINWRLTGVVATDPSYASGSGVFDLAAGSYCSEFIEAAGLSPRIFPEVLPSTAVIGGLHRSAALELGLPSGVPVVAGGVDNACMALGSLGTGEGRVYASLGSSSWITVTSAKPVLSLVSRPFVFAHVIPGLSISALSTFSSGTTLTWLRDTLALGEDLADVITQACDIPRGAEGLLFLPMLSGGTPAEGGGSVRGALKNLDLMHTPMHIVRAALEGIALSLRRGLNELDTHSQMGDAVLLTGGGSRHQGWNQIYSDVFDRPTVRSTVGQQAAALGAATLALVGVKEWSNFDRADASHELLEPLTPDHVARDFYANLAERFERAMRSNAAEG